MFQIEEELKKLPDKPGVYLMFDENDTVIYVGKAVVLKNRVRQYFRPSHNEGIKKDHMVRRIARFEYIVTESELEALILECNLIKEHRPKYNTMLRDDKTYPYIKVTLGEVYPRVLFCRQVKKDGAKYFGPYSNVNAVKNTIELLCKIYKIRTCNRKLPQDIGKERACLNYHIHQCEAPCQGCISEAEYADKIQQVLSFLGGNYQEVYRELKTKMQEASEKLDFEKAMEYRELADSIQAIAQKQKVSNVDGEDKDIIALQVDGQDAVVQVFFVREGRLMGREHCFLRVGSEAMQEEIIASFIKQFYAGAPYIPREIMIPEELEDGMVLEEWLSGRRGQRVYLRVPKRGEKERLMRLAQENAELILAQDKERLRREHLRTKGAVAEIAELIGRPGIRRMEAYDISNISGFHAVGSMIVFEDGRPKKNDYRKFKLKSVTGPDDYASMREVLMRRFQHGLKERELSDGKQDELARFSCFPDLIMMDGGKGQVNIAEEVLAELQLDIPVCGMVKDDHHRTRGLYYQNQEIPLKKEGEAFQLITRMQDEAHRFAIAYHRSLRGKGQVHSILDDIPGIGTVRRKALMRHFDSIEQIKNASEEDLAQIEGMDRKSAANVYNFFRE